MSLHDVRKKEKIIRQMRRPTRRRVQELFPSINRFITELPRAERMFYLKIFLVSFISSFLLVAIGAKGVTLITTVGQLQAAAEKREELQKQQQYWEKVVVEHEGYRDAYFQLALLSYQLGERNKAQRYMDQVLELDPNFEPGKALARELER